MGSEVQLQSDDGNSPAQVTLTSVSAGNALIAVITQQVNGDNLTGADAVASDVDGNFTRGNYVDAASNDAIYIYYLLNASAGTHVIDLTDDGSTQTHFTVAEYAETNAAIFGSASTGKTGSDDNPLSGAVTVAEADELLISLQGSAGVRTHTSDSAWGTLRASSRIGAFDTVNPSTGSTEHDGALNSSNSWSSCLVRFTPAAGGADVTPIAPTIISRAVARGANW